MMDKKESNRSLPTRSTSQNSLSQDRIKNLIIYAIQQYNQKTISLESLIYLVEMILASKTLVLPDKLKKILEEIKSLSIVENILNDILDELKHN
jgi:hypothetical protein